MRTHPCRVEIRTQSLEDNFRFLLELASPHTELMAVVKADAYGHSLELCAPAAVRAGARWPGALRRISRAGSGGGGAPAERSGLAAVAVGRAGRCCAHGGRLDPDSPGDRHRHEPPGSEPGWTLAASGALSCGVAAETGGRDDPPACRR